LFNTNEYKYIQTELNFLQIIVHKVKHCFVFDNFNRHIAKKIMVEKKHLDNINPLSDYILINKPLGWTSFQVVNKLRYAISKQYKTDLQLATGEKRKIKVGHAGTLDPLAEGLLILCVGMETKNIEQYMATEKVYTGSFYIGATTPSYDKETEVDQQFDISHITKELIIEKAQTFVGEQMQMPPIFSAIKKDGQRAYSAARKGQTIELNPRLINILSFEITEISMPLVYFKIKCSKGTYIRSIAFDFGNKLKCGAYLNSLCRTESGIFKLEDASSIDEFLSRGN
jgi:tRNA pseudouridine55 synthase